LFVALSKVLDLAVAPLTWSLLLLGAAALLRARRRAPWLLGGASAAVLLLFSADPVARALVRRLEASAPRTFRPDAVYDAAVVLGGAVDRAASRAGGRAELDDAADRLVAAFELWRAGRVRLLLLSGGLVAPGPDEASEAERLGELLRGFGVPAEAILLEPRSRNTRENALHTATLVRERGLGPLLLVTSAAHMERALGCFRAVGLAPDALPVDFRGGRGGSWLPRASALSRSTDALREMAGRVAYRLAGWVARAGRSPSPRRISSSAADRRAACLAADGSAAPAARTSARTSASRAGGRSGQRAAACSRSRFSPGCVARFTAKRTSKKLARKAAARWFAATASPRAAARPSWCRYDDRLAERSGWFRATIARRSASG
jgi:uncharacterized SAM-binding protein YcdF (DUF218 family)